MLVTRMLRDSRIAARDAAAMPFPREETTPPVTKTYLAIYPARVGMEESTRIRATPQSRSARHAVTTHSPMGRQLALQGDPLRIDRDVAPGGEVAQDAAHHLPRAADARGDVR